MYTESNEITRADRILQIAEDGIQELIKECLREQRYDAVSALARLAAGVASVRGSRNGQVEISAVAPSSTPSERVTSEYSAPAAPRSRVRDEYPRFELDGDRLVKVGWSKKDKRAYEHKAPKGAVMAVCTVLELRGKAAATFTMEELLPVTDAAGDEVPSYQVYLVVAWLRQLGIVERTGKDGYLVKVSRLTQAGVKAIWEDLPSR